MENKKKLKNLIFNSSLSKNDKDLWVSYLIYLSEEQIKILIIEMENDPIIIKELNNQLKELNRAFNFGDEKNLEKILNREK